MYSFMFSKFLPDGEPCETTPKHGCPSRMVALHLRRGQTWHETRTSAKARPSYVREIGALASLRSCCRRSASYWRLPRWSRPEDVPVAPDETPDNCCIPKAYTSLQFEAYDTAMRGLSLSTPGIHFHSLWRHFCDDTSTCGVGRCGPFVPGGTGQLALHDINHLSLNGATYIAEHVANFARCKLGTRPSSWPCRPRRLQRGRDAASNRSVEHQRDNQRRTRCGGQAEWRKGALVAPNAHGDEAGE